MSLGCNDLYEEYNDAIDTMITPLLTIPSLLFLAAHALRLGSSGGAIFWLIAAGLALSPVPWKNWAIAGLLGFGAWLWGDITLALIEQRIALDLPWQRLAAIMGTVALICLAAAVMNCRRANRETYPGSMAQGLTFLLTIVGLSLARQKTPLDIILVDRFFPGGGWIVIILLGCYATWIVGKMLDPANSAKWRRTIWLTFSAVFFLQLSFGLLGFERFLMTGDLHLPIPALIAAGPLYRGEGFFMIILFAATLLLVGPAWCSHLCYFGAWDNLAATNKVRPGALPRWTKTGKWLICLAVLGAAIVLGQSGQPVSLAIALAVVFGLGGVAIMLFWSRRKGLMVHCTTYCPMGLIANIFGKVNPWRVRISPECCKCNKCSRYCRYEALTPQNINKGKVGLNCTLCGDCISGCPQGHLHYSFPGLSHRTARSAFIVIIVVLHAIFLGVARL